MCSRLSAKNKQAMSRHLSIEKDDTEFAKLTDDARPTDPLPVVANDAPKTLTTMRWGLIPSWAKMEMGKWPTWLQSTFNARSEDIASKPVFRTAFERQRCLVPTDGFYEWSGTTKARQKHFITLRSGEPMVMAGLWDVWEGEGGFIRSFTVLTCEPNETMAAIHTRMPVILASKDYDRWLNGSSSDVQDLMQPCPDAFLLVDSPKVQGGLFG
jgi:putative SOS response-associated peptidase YedK